MRTTLLLAVAALAGCDRMPPPDAVPEPLAGRQAQAAIMDAIERQVVLPPGAFPLARYARFYTAGAGDDVAATYVGLPPPEWPIGQRRWLRGPADMPMIDDGGCSVVSLLYDRRQGRVREIGCNGPPPPLPSTARP